MGQIRAVAGNRILLSFCDKGQVRCIALKTKSLDGIQEMLNLGALGARQPLPFRPQFPVPITNNKEKVLCTFLVQERKTKRSKELARRLGLGKGGGVGKEGGGVRSWFRQRIGLGAKIFNK